MISEKLNLIFGIIAIIFGGIAFMVNILVVSAYIDMLLEKWKDDNK